MDESLIPQDITLPGPTVLPPTAAQQEAAQMPETFGNATRSPIMDAAGHAAHLTWITENLRRSFDSLNLDLFSEPYNSEWIPSEPEWKSLTSDLSREYWPRFADAHSFGQAWAMRENSIGIQHSKQRLAAMGGIGTAGSLIAGFTDPVTNALFAAGGPLVNSASRIGRMTQLGAVTVGAVEPSLLLQANADPTITNSDLLISTAGAFAGGAMFGAFTKAPKLNAAAQRLSEQTIASTLAKDATSINAELTEEGSAAWSALFGRKITKMADARADVLANREALRYTGIGQDTPLPSDYIFKSPKERLNEPYWEPSLRDMLLEPEQPLPPALAPAKPVNPKEAAARALADLGPQNAVTSEARIPLSVPDASGAPIIKEIPVAPPEVKAVVPEHAKALDAIRSEHEAQVKAVADNQSAPGAGVKTPVVEPTAPVAESTTKPNFIDAEPVGVIAPHEPFYSGKGLPPLTPINPADAASVNHPTRRTFERKLVEAGYKPDTVTFKADVDPRLSHRYTSGSGQSDIIVGTKGITEQEAQVIALHELGHHFEETEGTVNHHIANVEIRREVDAFQWAIQNAERLGVPRQAVEEIAQRSQILKPYAKEMGITSLRKAIEAPVAPPPADKLDLTPAQRAEYEKIRAAKGPKPEAANAPAEEADLSIRKLRPEEAAKQDVARQSLAAELDAYAEKQLAESIRRNKGRVNFALDPKDFELAAKYGTAKLLSKALNYEQFSADMISRWGDAVIDDLPRLYSLAQSSALEAAARTGGLIPQVAENMKQASGGEATFKDKGLIGRAINYVDSKITMMGHAENSPITSVRKAVRALGWHLPSKDGDPAVMSATQFKVWALQQSDGELMRRTEPLVENWTKRNNFKPWQRLAARDKFMNEVRLSLLDRSGKYSTDPDVLMAVEHYRKSFANALKDAVEAGVPRAAEIATDPHYAPRVPVMAKFVNMADKFGLAEIEKFFQGAIRKGSKTLTDKEVEVIGRAYARNNWSRGWDASYPNHPAFNFDRMSEWRQLLLNEGMSAEDIDRLVAQVAKPSDAKTPRYFKSRIDLDDAFTLPVKDKQGNSYTLSMSDFVETNAELLNHGYRRSIYSAIAERKLLEMFAREGEEAAPSWETLVKRIVNDAATQLTPRQKGAFDRDISALNLLHDVVMGNPRGDLAGWQKRWLNMILKVNGLRLGGMFGVAQLPEYGNILGEATYLSMTQKMAILRDVTIKARGGELDNALAREIQQLTGAGDEMLSRYASRRYEDLMRGEVTPQGRTERGLDEALRLQSNYMSFVAPIDSHERIAVASIWGSNLTEAAFSKTAPSAERLAVMGLRPEEWERVAAALRQHGKQIAGESGVSYRIPNFAAWEDKELASKLLIAIYRGANDGIQTNNAASLSQWMTHPLAQLLLQFRNYPMAAMRQQLMRGIYLHDTGTFASWSYQIGIGTLAYIGLVHARSIGLPKTERAKYLKKYLTNTKIGAGAFQRAGFTGILPGAIDTALWTGGFDQQFAVRASGNPSNAIQGSATFDLMNRLYGATRTGVAGTINPNYHFSQQDFRNAKGLMFWNNVFGISQGLNALGTSLNLPKTSLPPKKD